MNFILAGVSCPRASQTVKGESTPGEAFGDEALLFSKELILQREVRGGVGLLLAVVVVEWGCLGPWYHVLCLNGVNDKLCPGQNKLM